MTESKKKSGSTGALLMVLIIIIFGVWAFSKCNSSSTDTSSSDTSSETSAFVISKNLVEDFLISPSSADFPYFENTTIGLGGGRYEVTSYVDSENGFGVIVRSDWIAIVKWEGNSSGYGTADAQNWELEKLIFGGEVVYP
jgi:hypothetical protein